jgi:ribosomal protein S18 acetylase RimI-like enzyme
VVWYRPFRNSDPPRLLALWNAADLGRGAAGGFSTDAFEVLIFSQPYFEREGLILAFAGDEGDESQPLGFVQVGFGPRDDGSGIDRETGVLCAIAVRPDQRRTGLGSELLSRGIAHLRHRGASTILAGPAPGFDPFYIGMYGGARVSGFLESDPAAAPFLRARGFQPLEAHGIFARNLDDTRDPVNFRLVTVRRRMELRVGPEPVRPNRWWLTRFGRLDSVRFLLCPKPGGPAVAGVTVVGLDLYVQKWNARAVGLMDVFVPEEERRKGYAQVLLLEVCRRLREELVTRVEMHVPESNEIGTNLLRSCAFEQVDRGIVYRLAE